MRGKRVGFEVSFVKSKGMLAGIGADNLVLAPISVERRGNGLGGDLGSIISSDGDLYGELSRQLAKAAKIFGCLH